MEYRTNESYGEWWIWERKIPIRDFTVRRAIELK